MRPGIVSKTQDGKIQCRPILSRIVSLFAEQNELQYAVPARHLHCGLIGHVLYVCVWIHSIKFMYFSVVIVVLTLCVRQFVCH